MSLPNSSNMPSKQYRKPRADVFTALLVIALLAVLLGLLFFYLELRTYDFKHSGGPSFAATWDSCREFCVAKGTALLSAFLSA